MPKKRIVDARTDEKGNIKDVRFTGNSTFTDVETAMRMADRGDVENAHTVRPNHGKKHLRTNPDRSRRNNLDEMAGDT